MAIIGWGHDTSKVQTTAIAYGANVNNADPPQAIAASLFVIGSFVAACTVEVERLPSAGESVRGHSFALEPGGKGFNVAAAARRLGLGVDGVFVVGTDWLGDMAIRAFDAVGLDPGMVTAVDGSTGGGVGLIDSVGETRIAVCSAANDALGIEHVAAAADRLRAARVVYAQFESPDAPILHAFALARAAGVTTILNPSPMRAIGLPLLALTDIVIVNEAEARLLIHHAGFDPPVSGDDWSGLGLALSRWCFDAGLQALILTRGARGARIWSGGRMTDHPGFTVRAVDAVGAGDAFAAAIIDALLDGRCWDDALRMACAAGAIVASRRGALAALPDAADITRFLAGYSIPLA